MRRNETFSSPQRQPGQPGYTLKEETVSGPLPFFNPTRARLRMEPVENSDGPVRKDQDSSDAEHAPLASNGAQIEWRSRDNRKGRHMVVVSDASQLHQDARRANTARAVLQGLWRMCTVVPYWDISYLIGVFFTVGCAIFIACGLFYWLPIVNPSSEFSGEATAGGVTAFVGATFFQIGAVLLVFEACNENQAGCFGWALKQVFSGEGTAQTKVAPDPDRCQHHHQQHRTDLRGKTANGSERTWTWWPTWEEFTTHYIREIGFVASTSLSLGATIFYVSGICSLPWIFDNMSLGVQQGVYSLTYLVGGVIFVFSSVLYVLETQPNWYTPAPRTIGWHIGVWNLIGSVGWTLSAAFGYCQADWCTYQGDLTLIWASMAFFIGSALLWYEALDKYPVKKERNMSD